VDGNEYVDFVNGLLAISLGYADPDVDKAVKEQLANGVLLSLPHPLEIEVAERIVDMVPCAEQVRFGKNGSDATAGAIRLARAYTGRDHVAVCGYHGWQDWYIGSTTRDRGVPTAIRKMTHHFRYNDISSLAEIFAEYPHQIAAVMLEPMNVEYPQDGFLEAVCDMTRERGAVVVFDEMITGFRFARGGAQEYFNVVPDLVTLGKGIANGYPLSVLAGRRELMRLMEDVFFSFTFGGETLSLAAAKAVLDKIEAEPVIERIRKCGERILADTSELIEKHGVESHFSLCGHPAWSFLLIKEAGVYSQLEIKTLFMQEMLRRGILFTGTHNVSFAHSDADIQMLIAAYDEVFPLVRDAVSSGDLNSRLHGKVLEPLFKVR